MRADVIKGAVLVSGAIGLWVVGYMNWRKKIKAYDELQQLISYDLTNISNQLKMMEQNIDFTEAIRKEWEE